jgi:hypothetical protein
VAHRDALRDIGVFHSEPRYVVADGFVQVELAFLHQAHDKRRGESLRRGTYLKKGMLVDLKRVADVSDPETSREFVAVAENADCHAWHSMLLHRRWNNPANYCELFIGGGHRKPLGCRSYRPRTLSRGRLSGRCERCY